MLTQEEADNLIGLVKVLIKQGPIALPNLGAQAQIRLTDDDTGKTKFMIDMQRKTLNVSKITYQTRAMGVRLLRVDIEGPAHPNPDGTEIECPHIHIYQAGYELGWAFPLEDHIITDTTDLAKILIDFLKYNHVKNIPLIMVQRGGIV